MRRFITAMFLSVAAVDASAQEKLTQCAGLVPSPYPVVFGGQSLNTTSPAITVTLSNIGGGLCFLAAELGTVAASPGYDITRDTCSGTTLVLGQRCEVDVTFTPRAEGPVAGTLSFPYTVWMLFPPAGATQQVPLSGTGERTLVTHYYQAILGRAPDAAGKAFWEGEAARVQALQAGANAVWHAMSMSFFGSAEYALRGRSDAAYLADLYTTFFNRPPDPAGFDYWLQQMAAGMPREGVLVSFMFSPEFGNFTTAIFGAPAARVEVNLVMDFYRGLLSRLPDSAGFAFFVSALRAAQCAGAGAVRAQVENVSSGFLNSPEYSLRGRSNAQFVADVYNAFMRRGPDLAGISFYIDQLNTGGKTREQIRQELGISPEFSNRVSAIVAEACIP